MRPTQHKDKYALVHARFTRPPFVLTSVGASARAQDTVDESAQSTATPAPVQVVEVPPTAPPPEDGPRFRFGFAGAAGFERANAVSGWLIGADVRLGVQINDLVGIFVEPHFAVGQVDEGASSGTTGNFTVAGMVDFTLIDRVFAGAGFGYGVANNPSGPMLAFRVGGYPVVTRSTTGPRRKGLSVGLDLRVMFLGAPYDALSEVMFTVGYEAF